MHVQVRPRTSSAQVAGEYADLLAMITGHAMDDLLAVVGRERQVLERLLYRLLQTAGMLAGAETRFLHWLSLDLERVAEHLREIDLQRSIIAIGVQDHEPGAPPALDTMAMIAEQAPPPYRFLLDDHQQAMRALLREIGTIVAHIRDLIQERLARLAHPVGQGRSNEGEGGGRDDDRAPMDALDREILGAGYAGVLNACDRLRLPELFRFLDC